MVPNLPVLKSNFYESLDSFGDRFSVSFATVLDSFGTVLGWFRVVLGSGFELTVFGFDRVYVSYR